MKAKIHVEQPESLLLTLELTMRYSEWKELYKQLGDAYPSWQFSLVIGKLLRKVDNEIESDSESDV